MNALEKWGIAAGVIGTVSLIIAIVSWYYDLKSGNKIFKAFTALGYNLRTGTILLQASLPNLLGAIYSISGQNINGSMKDELTRTNLPEISKLIKDGNDLVSTSIIGLNEDGSLSEGVEITTLPQISRLIKDGNDKVMKVLEDIQLGLLNFCSNDSVKKGKLIKDVLNSYIISVYSGDLAAIKVGKSNRTKKNLGIRKMANRIGMKKKKSTKQKEPLKVFIVVVRK